MGTVTEPALDLLVVAPGPCPSCGVVLDPVALGMWLATLPGDDPCYIAVRLVVEIRDDRAAGRRAGLDIHGGDTDIWSRLAERYRTHGDHAAVVARRTEPGAADDVGAA